MPPSEYSFRLQRGIAGGFAPPTPDAVYTVTRAAQSSDLQVTRAIRPDGTPSLNELAPKQIAVAGDSDALIDELYTILKSLPTENPPGSEDIYGLNVSIAWGSEDLMWCNGGPQGCGGGTSSVQATDEEKAKFKRAVEIVEQLAA